eukprot:CAMPEP_0204825676 /NCGR_PEP_ID=MMETSP1346-20131115/3514_1 /ASSEMBLY_ACC=CAM_ASM_000771 /TAXON_ID=215587 /ORGANISM="Aplanochytrium stocchinoi, Strain GSBS06" /LENGTH=340 /DNA_ID=CAMNT_0051953385 /DNA_START=115 /DNA_END=1137 /DNA_ORIENTATION=+
MQQNMDAGEQTSVVPASHDGKIHRSKRRTINLMLQQIAAKRGLEYSSLSEGFIQILQESKNETNKVENNGAESDAVTAEVSRNIKEKSNIMYVYGSSFQNGFAAQSICSDKAALSSVLSHHGIPNIPHKLIYGPQLIYNAANSDRKNKGTMPELINYLSTWSRHGLVIKQKDGTQGIDVFHVRNQLELETVWLDMLSRYKDFVVCPFIPIQDEWRLVMINNEMRLCYRKVRANPEKEWRHNLSRGATVDEDVPESLIREKLLPLALKTTQTLGIRYASADIVRFQPEVLSQSFGEYADNEGYAILEINCGIMMSEYVERFPDRWEHCRDIYDSIVQDFFE